MKSTANHKVLTKSTTATVQLETPSSTSTLHPSKILTSLSSPTHNLPSASTSTLPSSLPTATPTRVSKQKMSVAAPRVPKGTKKSGKISKASKNKKLLKQLLKKAVQDVQQKYQPPRQPTH